MMTLRRGWAKQRAAASGNAITNKQYFLVGIFF